jgi:hypothetical protein
MAVISRPHLAHSGAGLGGLMRGLFYLAMAIVVIVVAVPLAIATVG